MSIKQIIWRWCPSLLTTHNLGLLPVDLLCVHCCVFGGSSAIGVHSYVGRFDVPSAQVFFGEASFIVVFLSLEVSPVYEYLLQPHGIFFLWMYIFLRERIYFTELWMRYSHSIFYTKHFLRTSWNLITSDEFLTGFPVFRYKIFVSSMMNYEHLRVFSMILIFTFDLKWRFSKIHLHRFWLFSCSNPQTN